MGRMNLALWPLALILLTGFSAAEDLEVKRGRDGKLLPVFQVVRFPNDPCVGGTNNGTCYTAEECSNRGGTNDGSCAEGFGVCCTFTYGCGTSSSENCTYFTNSNPVAGPCSHKVCPVSSDICSIRLDMTTMVITGPTTISTSIVKLVNGQAVAGAGKVAAETGRCLTDTFSVSNQYNLPSICGTNSGAHVYFDAAEGCNSLDFNLGSAAVGLTAVATRTWTIKVTQISCTDMNKPPSGCDQYYFGSNLGYVTTFNYNSGNGRHLANQHQSICVRKEQSMCRICWSADKNTDVSLGSVDAQKSSGKTAASDCCGYTSKGSSSKKGGYDCLMIPGAISTKSAAKAPQQCANKVGLITKAADAAKTTKGGIKTVCSKTVPFRVDFLSDGYEWVTTTESANTAQTGFKLKYFLTSC